MQRYPSIPEDERRLSEDLLRWRGDDPIGAFSAHFRERAPQARTEKRKLPLADRLAAYVIEGTKDGLEDDLGLALRSEAYGTALDVVNGPLMAGMEEVGRLFNANELIVAEVLQSASAMKAAVAFLEPHMEKAAASRLGRIVLATVKGDVHDIGKNLVDIVLTNNGFEVVNLGIKIPSERLIEAVQEHGPDLIGLSGLLVKSAQMMVTTAEDLREAGIEVPLLVGGAALSPAFTYGRIAPAYGAPVAYARDAMHGLDLARRFVAPDRRGPLLEELTVHREKAERARAAKAGTSRPAPAPRAPAAVATVERPSAPPTDRVVLPSVDLDEVWPWVNPQMLYGKHLGLRGNVAKAIREGDPKAEMLVRAVDDVKAIAQGGTMVVSAIYRFFPVRREGDRVHVLDPETGAERTFFDFPRQTRGDGLSVADFVAPDGETDHLGLFVVTAGHGIRERVSQLREDGRYLESHALGALAVETAEGAAEWLHARRRALWGFPDPDGTTMADRFRCAYRGCRYSFGYPACPDLEDQRKLFDLLDPSVIGVALTEGFMMDPEASVSALVVHHPAARYFAV
jgi:5-methyltetrahydrofolate--homocysteine methyltransferase